MTMTNSDKIIAHLKLTPDEKFTAIELANYLFDKYPDDCQEKKKNSKDSRLKTDEDLINQLAAEISHARLKKRQHGSMIKTTEGRPREYYYSEKSDVEEVTIAESVCASSTTAVGKPDKFNENDMYPLLSDYLLSEFGVYSKRIDEKRSSNSKGRGGNHWLHPDLVGIEDLGVEWKQEVQDCVKQYSDKRTKLWSFEVKILINRSNVRECFFQAVSNSSWANFGYLVALEIEGANTRKELRMLFAAHGIGLIQLDAENPSESQVLIPAREMNEIDWTMANRLAEENSDFTEYVKLVKQFYQTGEIKPTEWDARELSELMD
jgi:uncharacterized protein